MTSTFDGSKLVIEKTSLAILPSVIYTNVITTIIIGLIAGVITLLVSHRIAGPMFWAQSIASNSSAKVLFCCPSDVAAACNSTTGS